MERQLFTRNVYEVPRGAGSGFVWNPEGFIITNFHVVYDADSLTVVLADHTEHEARVVGVDPDHDLAVLQIQVTKGSLPPIAVGSSHDLEVGQKVLAIGNGPLLDSGGRLIGINTMIVSPSGAFSGIGFAVPVDTINEVVPQLIQNGRIIRPGIGVSLLPDSVAQRADIKGVIIEDVAPGGPADRPGLRGTMQARFGRSQLGDVIVALDGEPVRTADDMRHLLERRKTGAEVHLEVMRYGRVREVTVTLEGVTDF